MDVWEGGKRKEVRTKPSDVAKVGLDTDENDPSKVSESYGVLNGSVSGNFRALEKELKAAVTRGWKLS